ncbi:MAG TPA: twin-arginine translocation signal domain-containing protein [Bacteroidota bacterium]
MSELNNPFNRRSFLGKLSAGAVALGVPTLAGAMHLPTTKNPPPASDSKGFEEWLGRIKGTHKQVFDTMMHDNGMPLAWTRVFLMTNAAVGASANDVTAVMVLRHEAIPLALEDRLWAKYNFGEMFKVTDGATKAPATRNMFWKPKPNELPLPGMALNELLDSGVLVGLCDMALTVYSSMAAKKMNMSADDCKKDWLAGVLPGIQLVPSGVLAVNRAQEHGCTYCWAG